MAGVTNAGFVPKRFNEILTSLRENAQPIFQDLVKPGEEVDTGDTSTIGRLTGLIATDLDEIWQALQQVYQAFDPNSATGVALDNIVQYMGVTRQLGRPTVLRVSVWGQVGTFLPQGQVIRGISPDRFYSTTALTFSVNDLLGFTIKPSPFQEGDVYSFTIIIEEGVYTFSHTAQAGETTNDILLAWKSQFDSLSLTRYTVDIESEKLYFVLKEYYAFVSVPSMDNSNIVDVKRRLTFQSEVDADVPAPVGTVTTILTPVFGWTSVDNEISAEKGASEETDEDLRERFRVSKAVRANNMGEALYSQLRELEDVSYVSVYENMTDVTDIRNLPPHSFMAIVRGGVDTNIGEIIWKNKPLGISSEGNTSVVVRDSQNLERTVKFSRATEVPIYVSVTVKKVGNTFPNDGAEQIRQAIVEFLNTDASFGQEIIYTRLFTPINSVPGHQVDDLKIGKSSATMGTSNLIVSWEEFPIALPENIEVTVTS